MKDSREPSVPPRMLVLVRREAGAADGFHRVVDDLGVTVDHLLHVAVLLLDLHPIGRARKVLHHVFDDAFQQLLPFPSGPRSVKSRTMKLSVAFSSAPEMPIGCRKALLAFGGFRRAGILRQALDDARRDLDGVLHLALGKAGMGADAFDRDRGAIGGEGFVLDIPGGFAVDGIGEIGAELFQVGLVDAAADLFIGREQDLDGAVLDVRIVDQEMRRIHDFGEAGLVVGAEQRGAVGGDDVVADLVGERGIVGDADDLRWDRAGSTMSPPR